jgi:hypothetical protein
MIDADRAVVVVAVSGNRVVVARPAERPTERAVERP